MVVQKCIFSKNTFCQGSTNLLSHWFCGGDSETKSVVVEGRAEGFQDKMAGFASRADGSSNDDGSEKSTPSKESRKPGSMFVSSMML